jgi:cellulose synthase/poly-beta-1,6-N-acetylglucosamine synthase-like glycosyltransferase
MAKGSVMGALTSLPAAYGLAIFDALIAICVVTVVLRNLVGIVQLAMAWWVAWREARPTRDAFELWQRTHAHAPRISVIAPAFNEELAIAQSVRSLLALQYPDLELIVVNDGSKDRTVEILRREFALYPVERPIERALHQTRVIACYASHSYPNLLVVDKENGRKADAANAGISYSSGELICVIDSDSVIDPEGLLRAVQPFMDSDGSVIAVGGSIRVANGCEIRDGHVLKIGTGRQWLPLFQTLEYFRAFLAGRVASAHWNMLLLISGAFGLFRRDAVVAAGGYQHDCLGEDLELLVRLQRLEREAGRRSTVAYLPEICCWTEVPATLAGVRNQRTRWQQGGLQVLSRHRRMLFNPRYGRLGMVAFPLVALEDLIGPIVELLGYGLMIAGLALGILDPVVAAVYFLLTCVLGCFMSAGVLIIEDQQLRPTGSVRDLGWLLAAAIAENFGYRQLIQYYRLRGVVHFLRGVSTWASAPRTGLGQGQVQGQGSQPTCGPDGDRRQVDQSITQRGVPASS